MANSTGDSPCTRDNRFDTFPINFLMIFFVIGFGSSFVSCMFVNRFSYIVSKHIDANFYFNQQNLHTLLTLSFLTRARENFRNLFPYCSL